MYKTILKKFSEVGIHLNSEQDNFLKIFEKNLPRSNSILNFLRKKVKKGCYLYGDVGRGKTMLLKSIFNEIKQKKISYHYIEFMRFIHEELELVKKNKDPLVKVAQRIASKYEVILIDEFQIEDISDAMIVGKLLNLLSELDVFFMLTSNAKIDDLYKNGLQRDKFIKQIKQLEKNLVVFQFIGNKDYRLKNIDLSTPQNSADLNEKQIFDLIKKNFNFIGNLRKEITISGRTFFCKGSSKDFIWLSYKDFFKQNLAISDFLVICKNYEWFFIDDFEEYDDHGKDIIRRFIGFIDIAYIERDNIKFLKNNEDLKSLYSGEELIVLWNRTISRLEEMRFMQDK